jgi:hypothetical protein
LSVNDFKRMNNESYIRITLSNLAALLAWANVLVIIVGTNFIITPSP